MVELASSMELPDDRTGFHIIRRVPRGTVSRQGTAARQRLKLEMTEPGNRATRRD